MGETYTHTHIHTQYLGVESLSENFSSFALSQGQEGLLMRREPIFFFILFFLKKNL